MWGAESPAEDLIEITPDDADLADPIRGFYVNDVSGGSEVELMTLKGTTVTLNVSNKTFYPFGAKQIRAGTTATVLGIPITE